MMQTEDDSYSRVLRIMELCGQVRSRRAGNLLASLLSAFFTTNSWLGVFLFSFLAEGLPTDLRILVFIFGLGGLTLNLKFLNTLLRQGRIKRILQIFKKLEDQNFTFYGTEVREEFEKMNKSAFKSILYFMNGYPAFIVCKCAVVSLIGPNLDLPHPCWTFLDFKEWFVTNFIWQTVTLCFVMFHGSISYSFFYLTINNTAAHMRVLSIMLTVGRVTIREAIQRHILILRLVREINELFCWQLVQELGFYSIQGAYIGFALIKLFKSHGGLETAIVDIYVMCLYMFFAYFYCTCGHKIGVEGDKLFESIYDCNWSERSIQDRKSLALMLCMAGREVKLAYKNLMTFNNQRFSGIINASYSYLSLLFNMDI
uniref:Odorant receptor n=1 Tax=Yemma signatus TaxID=300820 RepID=A0A385H6T0_9HEMI|nr:odorant receptor [Yemma signatus]